MKLTTHARQGMQMEDALQKRIETAVYAELLVLWREVRLHLGKLKDIKPVIKAEEYTVQHQDLWEAFQYRLHQRLLLLIYSGGLDLLEHQIDLAMSRGISSFDFNYEQIIDKYVGTIGEQVTNVTLNTQKMVADKITKWYKTPGETMGQVINDLRGEFGRDRAELIAQTEITRLSSHIEEELGATLGYNTWWNETRRDQLVCKKRMVGPEGTIVDGCRALHGKVFIVGKHKMPPHHPGCRCKAHIIHGPANAGYVGQLSFGKWEEAEHPRANDGRFGSKPGEKKQTVGGVIREKAKAMAPVIRNKQIRQIASDHFGKAVQKLDSLIDQKKMGYQKFTEISDAYLNNPDARNGFNDYVAAIRPYINVDKAEFDRTLLNIRNRYYQKLRAAHLKEVPVEVITDSKHSKSYAEPEQMRKALMEHPDIAIATKKINDCIREQSNAYHAYQDIVLEHSMLEDKAHQLRVSNKLTEADGVENEALDLWEKQKKLGLAYTKTVKATNTANQNRVRICRDLLVLPEGQHSKVILENFFDKPLDRDPDEEVSWLSAMTNRYGNEEYPAKVRMIVINRGKRSYHMDGRIYISKNAEPGVVAHEIGHSLEYFDDNIHNKCVSFLDKRTNGEKNIKLDIASPHHGYSKDEVCKPDKFINPYMGKDYKGKATEILSMGLGELYTNPQRLAREDPEYFDFIIGILRGTS